VRLDGRAILRTLVVAMLLFEALLVYFDIVVTYYEAIPQQPLQDLCNLVIEGSLGGWFSSVQTLVVGLVVVLILARVRAEPGSRLRVLGWGIVAFFFLYMAADDGAAIHEAVGTAFEDTEIAATAAGQGGIAASVMHAFPSYPWQLLFLPFLGALGAFTVFFSFREMPRRRSRMLVAAGLLCFVVAVGIDFVEGMETPYDRLTVILALHEDTIPHFSGVIEETIENVGSTLLLCAFLGHLLELCGDVRLRIRPLDPPGG
jgi:predicted membrane protein